MPLHSNVPRYARTRRNLKQLGTRQHLSDNKQSIEKSTKDLCESLDTPAAIPEDTPKGNVFANSSKPINLSNSIPFFSASVFDIKPCITGPNVTLSRSVFHSKSVSTRHKKNSLQSRPFPTKISPPGPEFRDAARDDTPEAVARRMRTFCMKY